MKRMSPMVILILLLASAPSLPAQTKKSPGSMTSGQRELKRRVERYYAAWNTLDVEKAGEYYAKDADLIFYDIKPLAYQGWSEYKTGVVRYFLSLVSSCKLIPNDDLRVTRRGTVAWTTLTFRLTGTLKAGGTMELDARHTAIWEKRPEGWLVVHEHVSVPLAD